MNTWMNNPNFLAAMAHSGWACSLTLTAFVLGKGQGREWALAMTAALLLWGIVKEFWYDARYELPRQTTWDNVTDFVEYLIGLALAWAVIFLQLHL